MKQGKHKSIYRIALVVFLSTAARSQWLDYKEPGIPRGKDKKVNLSAPAPRIGGRPDLTGVWMHEATPPQELKRLYQASPLASELDSLPPGMNIELQNKYGFNLLIDVEPSGVFLPGEPFPSLRLPEGLAVLQRISADLAQRKPGLCETAEILGWPQIGLLSEPFKIVQAPKETMILYEVGNLHRQIFVDGRQFPSAFNLPARLGYSVGRWEKDVFVVETRGFREGILDAVGHIRSEQMHITERFRRRDFGHMDVEMTFDDPVAYTRPFTVLIPHELVPDNDIFEMFCDNEKDAAHMPPPPGFVGVALTSDPPVSSHRASLPTPPTAFPTQTPPAKK